MTHPLEPTQDPAWVMTEDGFDPFREGDIEARFAIGNGLLGVRAARAASRGPLWSAAMRYLRFSAFPRTYIAGLFDTPNIEPAVPVLMSGPDWLRLIIRLDGRTLRLEPEGLRSHRRWLDLKRGLLIAEWRQRDAQGVTARIRTLRLVSQDNRALGVQHVEIDIEESGVAVTLEAVFDSGLVGLEPQHAGPGAALGVALWRSGTSGRTLAMAGDARLHLDHRELLPASRGPLHWSWSWTSRSGQIAQFTRLMAAARGDERAPDPAAAAAAALSHAHWVGWHGVLAAHEAAWAARWQGGDIEIEGDPAAQLALRFAAYHLFSAANPDDPLVSIGARALTGDGYLGHVFWDTEIHLLPFYTAVWPEAARALLMYRFLTLNGARAKAAAKGWKGALYAWESADTGYETTPETVMGPLGKPVEVLSGKLEQHISADIAYAVWQYWISTGDDAFLCAAGAEIVLETARFWASRAVKEADGKRHIRNVIGPDEYHEGVDDNAFTNLMARWNIRRGIEVAGLLQTRFPADWSRLAARLALTPAELAAWADAADSIATGLDPATGLYEQFAGYHDLELIDLADFPHRIAPMDVVLPRQRVHRSQILKQADVVALMVLLPEEFPPEIQATNFRHYAPRCAHDSSLSHSMHALAAARMGERDFALHHFRQSAAIDMQAAPGRSADGVHIASLGGLWQVAMLGFAGVQPAGETLSLTPRLPPQWTAMTFRTQWHRRELHMRITHDAVIATLERGAAMTLTVNGQAYPLTPETPSRIALSPPGNG
jgi:trehalose/maltose hydrolase-like predicted phosphorylase